MLGSYPSGPGIKPQMGTVFSFDLVCKEELNLMLKVSNFYSRCSGFELMKGKPWFNSLHNTRMSRNELKIKVALHEIFYFKDNIVETTILINCGN